MLGDVSLWKEFECGIYFELMKRLLPTLAYGLLLPLAQECGHLAIGDLFLE